MMSPVSPSLPHEVVSLVCLEALRCRSAAPSTLLTINRGWHNACAAVLYQHCAVPASLVDLEPNAPSTLSPAPSDSCAQNSIWSARLLGKMQAIQSNETYAGLVKALYIVPDAFAHDEPLQAGLALIQHDEICMHEPQASGLPCGFALTRLTGLRSLVWALPQPVPYHVLLTLHCSCYSLADFSFITNATRSLSLQSGNAQTVRAIDNLQSTLQPTFRWDALSLDSLPLESLAALSLQALSAEGVKYLASLCPRLESCGLLEVADSLFVDDALIRGVADMAGLKCLRIKRMGGTKLTSKGISDLMEGSQSLEELVLCEVEGRLSKKCWEELSSVPPNFGRLRISYAEDSATSHSWTVDHLSSITSLIAAVDRLEVFQVSRVRSSSDGAVKAVPDASPFQPQPLPDGFLASLAKHRDELRSLSLDFWELPPTKLRTVFEACPNVQVLQLLVDVPFPKLLSLCSGQTSNSMLQILRIMVPQRQVQEHMASGHNVARTRSASVAEASARRGSQHRPRQSSLGGLLEHEDNEMATMPSSREVKKMVKRFAHLSLLDWHGHGGLGKWEISRPGGAKDPKITFIGTGNQEDAPEFDRVDLVDVNFPGLTVAAALERKEFPVPVTLTGHSRKLSDATLVASYASSRVTRSSSTATCVDPVTPSAPSATDAFQVETKKGGKPAKDRRKSKDAKSNPVKMEAGTITRPARGPSSSTKEVTASREKGTARQSSPPQIQRVPGHASAMHTYKTPLVQTGSDGVRSGSNSKARKDLTGTTQPSTQLTEENLARLPNCQHRRAAHQPGNAKKPAGQDRGDAKINSRRP